MSPLQERAVSKKDLDRYISRRRIDGVSAEKSRRNRFKEILHSAIRRHFMNEVQSLRQIAWKVAIGIGQDGGERFMVNLFRSAGREPTTTLHQVFPKRIEKQEQVLG